MISQVQVEVYVVVEVDSIVVARLPTRALFLGVSFQTSNSRRLIHQILWRQRISHLPIESLQQAKRFNIPVKSLHQSKRSNNCLHILWLRLHTHQISLHLRFFHLIFSLNKPASTMWNFVLSWRPMIISKEMEHATDLMKVDSVVWISRRRVSTGTSTSGWSQSIESFDPHGALNTTKKRTLTTVRWIGSWSWWRSTGKILGMRSPLGRRCRLRSWGRLEAWRN